MVKTVHDEPAKTYILNLEVKDETQLVVFLKQNPVVWERLEVLAKCWAVQNLTCSQNQSYVSMQRHLIDGSTMSAIYANYITKTA